MVTTFTDTRTAFAAMIVAWKSTRAQGHIAAQNQSQALAARCAP